MSSRIIYAGMILALWLVFIAYWAIAAIGVKRDTRRHAWSGAIVFRVLVALFVLLLARSSALGSLSRYRRSLWIVSANPIIALSGVVRHLGTEAPGQELERGANAQRGA
jgi:hypothetical protein